MLIITPFILLAFIFPSAQAVDESSWNTLTPMPIARGGLGVAVVDGKIYAVGGIIGNLTVNNNEQYDPVINQWTVKAPMPTARTGFAIAVYNHKIYVIGGKVGGGFVGNNEVYDPSTNTWETRASMPTPRSDFSACVVVDKIYLIGGQKYSSNDPFFAGTSVNEVYDPANDSWSAKAPVPMAVYGYASATLNNKIYIVGGSMSPASQQNGALIVATQVYNPQTDNWSSAANLPIATTYGAGAATEDYLAPSRLYLVGGYSNNVYSDKTQVYNPVNDSWSAGVSMSAPRAYLGLIVVNDVLYALGGFDGQNWLNTNEMYKPFGYGTVPPKIQITSPENKTYSYVNVSFLVNRGFDWMGYSLDNQANVTVKPEIKFLNLTQGEHSLVLYANDSQGNMGFSDVIFFSIDSLPPKIVILAPQNQSYGTNDVQLTITVNEPISKLVYSLDGQENKTIIGNVTLPALPNGSHSLTVYAGDEVGNYALKTVYFSIAPFPFIEVTAIAVIITIVLASGYLYYKHRKTSSSQVQQNKLVE